MLNDTSFFHPPHAVMICDVGVKKVKWVLVFKKLMSLTSDITI